MKSRKAILGVSVLLTAVFIGAQFIFRTFGSGGAWCSPYLGAPVELGHPLYQFVNYGFPIPFLTIDTETCSEAGSTTYEWSPIGLGVEVLLLAMIAYPIWSRALNKVEQENSH